jgi:hypothetical protein
MGQVSRKLDAKAYVFAPLLLEGHVERRYVELIKHEAETEGVSITEVVNRALRMYFERR